MWSQNICTTHTYISCLRSKGGHTRTNYTEEKKYTQGNQNNRREGRVGMKQKRRKRLYTFDEKIPLVRKGGR